MNASVIEKLEVSILQNSILDPILGIKDPRTSPRISFVGGIKGLAYLQNQVDRNKAAVAFALPPVTAHTIMEVSNSDQIMPPKSTWFEPKLRCGFFLNVT